MSAWSTPPPCRCCWTVQPPGSSRTSVRRVAGTDLVGCCLAARPGVPGLHHGRGGLVVALAMTVRIGGPSRDSPRGDLRACWSDGSGGCRWGGKIADPGLVRGRCVPGWSWWPTPATRLKAGYSGDEHSSGIALRAERPKVADLLETEPGQGLAQCARSPLGQRLGQNIYAQWIGKPETGPATSRPAGRCPHWTASCPAVAEKQRSTDRLDLTTSARASCATLVPRRPARRAVAVPPTPPPPQPNTRRHHGYDRTRRHDSANRPTSWRAVRRQAPQIHGLDSSCRDQSSLTAGPATGRAGTSRGGRRVRCRQGA